MDAPNAEPPLVYSVARAAELLSVSESGVRNAIKRGEIETIAFGRRRLIPKRAIDRILEPK